jgi:glutamine synthetase
MERDKRGQRAARIGADLRSRGIRTVALTWVDHAGITRMVAVPVDGLARAATSGSGLPGAAPTDGYTGATLNGDPRPTPDLGRLTVLAAQPGWAWAPADLLTGEGDPHPCCPRSVAKAACARAAGRGLDLRMAFEVEWFLATGRDPTAALDPAAPGPAYGMSRVVAVSAYLRDLIDALDAQDVPVDQVHPEGRPGQFELSVAAADPVLAADRTVLVRQTVRAVSHAHGYRVSFAPVVVADGVCNGHHLHVSVRAAGRALFSGGSGPYGLTRAGEGVLAGLLDRLPALAAISAPSVASHLRLVPQRWVGPYQCWGRENREAALRLVTGSAGERDRAANAEVRCCDGAANPYLVVAAVTAIAAASVAQPCRLPPDVTGDPALLPEEQRPPRLPTSVPAALAALRADDVLPGLLGEPLLDAFCAVRQAEAAQFAGAAPVEIVEATRWRY